MRLRGHVDMSPFKTSPIHLSFKPKNTFLKLGHYRIGIAHQNRASRWCAIYFKWRKLGLWNSQEGSAMEWVCVWGGGGRVVKCKGVFLRPSTSDVNRGSFDNLESRWVWFPGDGGGECESQIRKFVHTNLLRAGFELGSLGPQASRLPYVILVPFFGCTSIRQFGLIVSLTIMSFWKIRSKVKSSLFI